MDVGRIVPASTVDVLLQRYAAAGATGCLRIDCDDMQARVYFRDGLVYTATAPSARARLGDRLVGAGHIGEDELAAALEQQRTLEEPRRIGELLIERGLIDRETMRTFVRDQSTDSVAVTLGWQAGSWAFTEGEEVPEDVPLDMSVENLLMEGARRLEEWEVILTRIRSVEAVPDFVSGDGAAELALTPDEWSMLTRIDGRSTIADIAEESGYSEFDAGRIIYGLLSAGIVRLVDDSPVEASGPVTAPAAPGAQEPFDPTTASELFGELGLDEATEAPGQREDAPEPEEPATAEAGEDAPAGEGPAGGREPVSRNELLREFAALDDAEGGADADQEPRPRPARPREGDREKEKRRGLFGRLRRD